MAGLGSFFLEIGVDSAALQRGLNNAESRLSAFGQRAEKIGTSLSLAISAPLALVGKNALQTSAQFESLEMSFGTMLRSMENGKTLMKDLQNYNLATSFQFEEVAGAGKSLLAFGFAQQQIIPQMKMIGDISAGVGINIKDLAEIYGKARVQGRLFAEDINQLTGRGIPIIAELAKQFGVSEQAVKKLTEDGKIGFGNLEQAFASMTSTGGQFFNMTANQSTTLGGLYSNLQDSVTMNLRTIGDSIVKNLDLKTVIPQASKYLTDLAEGFSKLSPEAQKAIVVMGGLAIVIPPLLALAGTVLPMVKGGFLALISPAGLAATALVAAAALIITNWDDVNDRIFRAKTNARKALLDIGMAFAGLQGVTDPTGAAEMRAKLFKSFNESTPYDPQAARFTQEAKKQYGVNSYFNFQKGKRPERPDYIPEPKGVNPPPPKSEIELALDKEKRKKLFEELAKEEERILGETFSLRKTMQSQTRDLIIASIKDETKRAKAEAQKRAEDEISAMREKMIGLKNLESEFANWRFNRESALANELVKIQRESFVVPQEIKRTMITDVMNSIEPKDRKKVTNDVMQNSLDRSIMLGTKGIQSEQDRNAIGKILGVEIDVTKWQSDSATYIAAAQSIVDANSTIKNSFKELGIELATQMSFIVGEMIAGTATMKDMSMMITSVISQELAKIAKMNIIAGIGTLISTGNPLKLLGGLAAGVGSGILSGINKKTASMQTQRMPIQSNTSQLRGGDLYWSQKRYETITGF
jgi:tape measure domain-containing protein